MWVLPFPGVEVYGGCREMTEAVRMVEMQVGEDHCGDFVDRNLEVLQLTVDLLVAGDVEFELSSHEPAHEEARGAEVAGLFDVSAFAGVDEEDAFGVFDGQDPDGEPFGEVGIDDGVDGGGEAFEAGGAEF